MVRIIISILLIFFSFQSHSQIAMFHAHNKSASITPPLDTYTGAAWAVSVRKLRTAYSGYCMKVRRQSDHTTQDIGFDANGYLNEGALLTFCGSSSGRVEKWYDQSGNGVDWVQSDTSKQPLIVILGAVVKINGIAAVRQIGISPTPQAKYGFTYTTTGGSTSTLFQIAHQYSGTPEGEITNAGTVLSDNNSEYVMLPSGGGSPNYSGSGTPSFWVDGVSKTITTRGQGATEYAIAPPALRKHRLLTMTNLNLSTYTSFETARFAGAAIYGDHFIAERIMYYSDKSSDRVNIQNNLNSYYSIY